MSSLSAQRKWAADSAHARMLELLDQPELTQSQRILVWVSCATAQAYPEFLSECLRLAFSETLSVLTVKEVILQNYLFCGFPPVIEALHVLENVRIEAGLPDANYEDVRTAESISADGEALCKIIYGKNFDRLQENMSRLSADLRTWMMIEGYGKVLSRGALPILERELCIVASLIASDRERQLHSHIRGAMQVGATIEQLNAVADSLAPFVSESSIDRARRLIGKVA